MNESNKLDNKKKIILIVSIVILIILGIVSATAAYFAWVGEESSISVTVVGEGSCSVKEDNDIFIEPTETRDGGRIIKFTAKQELAATAYISWTMTVNEIGGLQDATFKYEMINTTTGASYGSGNFADITDGSTIQFSNNTETLALNTTYEFTLYLWIDGTIGNNPLSMADQTFDFDISCTLLNIPSTEELQNKYQFEYYSTLNLAVTDVNNGTIGENADSDKTDAVAGVYTDEGETYVVLLKDATEDTRVRPSTDMTINLGGNKLTSLDNVVINIEGGNIDIDGSLSGSSIESISEKTAAVFQIAAGNVNIVGGTYVCDSSTHSYVITSAGNVNIDGGTYISNASGDYSFGIVSTGNVNIENATIISTNNVYYAYGIYLLEGSVSSISDCNIISKRISGDGVAYGVLNYGNLTLNSCNVNAYSNYNATGSTYTDRSVGVSNQGTIELNDCYAFGTHSGVSNHGTLYVNGGTYEGYGHGGFYFSGAGTTSYVQNAYIEYCEMPDGYSDLGAGSNNAGFYIGGGTDADNITVYMDNCDIYGSVQPIVLRGTSGEQNNTLYISNSTVTRDGAGQLVRIDNDTHKLYIGTGCNFTADDVTYAYKSVVTQTDEVYTKQ